MSNKIPGDPKDNKASWFTICNNVWSEVIWTTTAKVWDCIYAYWVDKAVSENDSYNINAALENTNNIENKAKKDWWAIPARLETYGWWSWSTIVLSRMTIVK